LNQQEKSRVFGVIINDIKVISQLDIGKTFGANRAVEKSFIIHAENRIEIDFISITGKPVLSGIKLETK